MTSELLRRHMIDARRLLDDVRSRYPGMIEGARVLWGQGMTRSAGKAFACGPPKGGVIKLSKHFFKQESNAHELRETVLHEIAHLLAYRHGHDEVWRRLAIEIGCTGQVCHSMPVRPKVDRRVEAHCLSCGRPFLVGPGTARKIERGAVFTHTTCGGAVVLSRLHRALQTIYSVAARRDDDAAK